MLEAAHVDPVEQHPPGGCVVEARDQIDQRGFSRAGCAQDRQPLARLGRQIDLAQDQFAAFRVVAEGDVLENHAPAGAGGKRARVRIVADFGNGREHFVHALGRGDPRRPGVGKVGHHDQRCHRREQVVGERHDLPQGEFPADGLQPAGPDHDHHADVDAHRQRRRHHRHEFHHPDRARGQLLVGVGEAPLLVIRPHKRPHQPDAGDVFLQHVVEPVQPLLDSEEERL